MKRSFALVFLLLVLAQARASELFIWISTPGTFEVTVGDQYQKSSKGKFRFFDLDSGYVSVKVKQQGTSGLFYEGRLQMRTGKCMVVEIGKNDLYHISHVDCSGNHDLPADGESHSSEKERASKKEQPDKTEFGNYHSSTDQGNKQNKADSTDYSKYHNHSGGDNYRDITDPNNKQNNSGNPDYSKYSSADVSNKKTDSTDYSKYHNNSGGSSNYRDITDPGNKQNSPGNPDYSKYNSNTGGGNNTNSLGSTSNGNKQNTPNNTNYDNYSNNTGSSNKPNKLNSTGQNNSNKTGTNNGQNNSGATTNNGQQNNSNNNISSNQSDTDYSNYHNKGACDEKSFSKIIQTLNGKTFESQKLEKAKEFASQTHFTSAQVKRICELMMLDSNKLDFAKYAYDNTADKENYSVVTKVFRFPPFVRDLEEYIGSK